MQVSGPVTRLPSAAGPGSPAAWFPEQAPPSPRRRRKHALAEQVRALIADVLLLDVETADEAALAETERLLSAARLALAALPVVRTEGLYLAGEDAHLFERSPLSGLANALAAPLTMEFDGARTLAHATYGPAYEGPPGSVHGGYVISAFDDLLGVAQAASGVAGLTGTLTVKLLRRTPLDCRIDYEAGVVEQTGRKVVAWGRSTHHGELLAEATGIFIEPRSGYLTQG